MEFFLEFYGFFFFLSGQLLPLWKAHKRTLPPICCCFLFSSPSSRHLLKFVHGNLLINMTTSSDFFLFIFDTRRSPNDGVTAELLAVSIPTVFLSALHMGFSFLFLTILLSFQSLAATSLEFKELDRSICGSFLFSGVRGAKCTWSWTFQGHILMGRREPCLRLICKCLPSFYGG